MTTKVSAAKLLDSTNLVSLDGLTLAEGDLLYATGVGTLVKLAKGTADQVLTMNDGATAPNWETLPASVEAVGTYTPAITFGGGAVGVTYSAQSGNYLKLGRMVIAQGQVTLTSKGTSTGLVRLTGLPFASLTGATFGMSMYAAGMASVVGNVRGTVSTGTSPILYHGSSVGDTLLLDTNCTNTSDLRFTVVYYTD